jgi:hypothetical protein
MGYIDSLTIIGETYDYSIGLINRVFLGRIYGDTSKLFNSEQWLPACVLW